MHGSNSREKFETPGPGAYNTESHILAKSSPNATLTFISHLGEMNL